MEKCKLEAFFKTIFFTTQIQLLFTKNITKHFLLLYFALKQNMEKVSIFWQKPKILGLFKIDFFFTEIQLLFAKNITKHFLLLYFALKQKMEKVFIFWIKPCSNPFEKCKFLGPFCIDVFYSQIKAFFVLQLFRTLFIDPFCIKTIDGKRINFLTKTMV